MDGREGKLLQFANAKNSASRIIKCNRKGTTERNMRIGPESIYTIEKDTVFVNEVIEYTFTWAIKAVEVTNFPGSIHINQSIKKIRLLQKPK